jgi:DNA primase
MALYTRQSRDSVRDAVDFVELVGARTELRRAGPARYEGLCPFHDERTPSFGIDPAQKVYYCFGCQASGDVFTFVQETEGVDFRGALELLSERYGVELQLEQEDPREAQLRQARERLLELLGRTAGYYERYLWESEEAAHARDYLVKRGLGEAILREFSVGYSPSAWDRVLVASKQGGFSARELYDAGLAQRSGGAGRIYDRFRSRIMFPLADIRGRVLGFGARALDHDEGGGAAQRGERRDSRRPKYLNTSDNDVYHKGKHLYGAHLARQAATKAGEVILCEGYTDVIALHQAGIRNAVGLMGTALTPEQVAELSRMANSVLLALDADTAGQEAMLRAYDLAARRDLALRVVPMPQGSDPADVLLADGPETMRELLARSVEFPRFRVERVLAGGDASDTEVQDRMLDELRLVFAKLPQRSAVRDELTQLVSSNFARSNDLVEKRLAERASPAPERAGRAQAIPNGAQPQNLSQLDGTERTFLALCIAEPELGAQALARLDPETHFSSDVARRAARYLVDGGLPVSISAPELEGDEKLRALFAELLVQAAGEEPNSEILDVQRLQLELAGLDRGIQHARRRDGVDVSALARQKAEKKIEFDRAYARVLDETGERER